MTDQRREEIERMLAEELAGHPLMAEFGFGSELRRTIINHYFINRRFRQMRLHRKRELTEREELECLRESIYEVMSRRRCPVLIAGEPGFTANGYDALNSLGFSVSTAGDIEEGAEAAAREDSLIVITDDSLPAIEFSKYVRRSGIDPPLAVVDASQSDFGGSGLLAMAKTLDQLIENAGGVPKITSISVIDTTSIAIEVADALAEKGIDAKVFRSEEEADFHEPTRTKIGLGRLTPEQKKFMIDAARNPDYTPRDMLQVIKHLESGRPLNLKAVMEYASLLRDFGIEQYVMRQYCRHSGNMARVRATTDRAIVARFGDNEEMQNEEIQRLARRNALQYFLNAGSGEDLHNRFMSKAFGAGYREFLLGVGQREYLTDEAFLNYVIRSVLRYVQSPEDELSYGVLTRKELETARKSIEAQLGIAREEAHEKFRQLAAAFAGGGIESRRLYRAVSLDRMVKALGGKNRAGKLKKRVSGRLKEVTLSYIMDENYGPKDLSSIIREERRVQSPSKNNVFRISARVMELGSVDAIVKVFDFRRDSEGKPLHDTARKRKRHEFENEVKAADYYSRWGINKGIHFFFEEYNEFGAVMMRYWGEHDLYETIDELSRLNAHEAQMPDCNNALINRWSARKDVLWANLMKRIAEVHAFSPDVTLRGNDRICDTAEGFEERMRKRIFRRRKKNETHLLQPFEQLGGNRHLCNDFRKVLGNLRKSCAAFAEYLEKSPSLQMKVASKDLSLKNWFESGSRLEEALRAEDIRPIDYGSIREFPAQMDVGNAFITSHLICDPDALMHYSQFYLQAYESAAMRYNRRVRRMASGIVESARAQFRKEELCRKSARKYVPELAAAVANKLEDVVSSHKGCRQLKDGRIHPDVIKAMKSASRGYIASLQKRKGKDAVDDVDIEYLKMFAGNAVRFFRNVKEKKEYLRGCKTREERQKKVRDFWEGMLASMAYTTFRNLGVYVDRITESIGGWIQDDPVELLGKMSEMIESGAVATLNSFLGIYKAKIGRKEGGYAYTQESCKEISRMAAEVEKAGMLYSSLRDYVRGAGSQQMLPGFRG